MLAKEKKLTFKINAPFSSCISKISNTFIDNAEDLDIAMSRCNLLGYSNKFFMTSGTFWNYCRDELRNDANENNDAGNYRITSNNTATSKSFEYKKKEK